MAHKFYEVVDTSSDEVYYPLGLFLSQNAAEKAISDCGDKPVSYIDNQDYEEIKIMERKEGLGDNGKEVFCLKREIYENEDGEYRCKPEAS